MIHFKNKATFEPTIQLISCADTKCKYQYKLTGCMVIGRTDSLCDIVPANDPTISSRHCRIYTEDDAVFLTNLSNTNPTLCNGIPVTKDVIIKDGDALTIGRSHYYIRIRK